MQCPQHVNYLIVKFFIMKRSKNYLLFALVPALFLLTACGDEKTASSAKVTDIPFTSKSKEAIAAFQEGLAFADDNNGIKARDAFTKAIQLDPNLAIAYLYRSNFAQSAKEGMDDLAGAKAHLDSASEWEKMYYDYENTFVNSDWNKRLEIVQKIAATYPDAARAQVDLGTTYAQGNQTDKERAAFQKAIELDPKWPGGYNALSNSYLFSEPKDFKKAEENASKVIELSPKSSNAQITIGDCYRAQNDLEKARTAYIKAVELNPDEPVAYYKKGHVNSFLGKYDEARNDYMEGAKHDVDNSGAMQNIGNTYLYAGDHKAALQSFMDNVAKLDASGASKSKIAINKLGYLFSCVLISFHDGDAAKLRETATMMQAPSDQLAADVGSPEEKSQQKANLLYWGALADAVDGKLDDAKAKAEEIKTTLDAIKTPTKLQGYEMAMGVISMKEKKYPEAISHFERTNPNDIYAKYWLAMADEAAGNKDKAMEIYKQLAVYNFNSTDYALIRNDVKKKAGM
jgi:tetratricopeptide (TPR) repeat protein